MRYRLAFAVLIASELFGCADVARWVRQFTYPPDFRYIERDEVRSAMRQLAHHARELNRLLQHSDAPHEQRNELPRSELRGIEPAVIEFAS